MTFVLAGPHLLRETDKMDRIDRVRHTYVECDGFWFPAGPQDQVNGLQEHRMRRGNMLSFVINVPGVIIAVCSLLIHTE